LLLSIVVGVWGMATGVFNFLKDALDNGFEFGGVDDTIFLVWGQVVLGWGNNVVL
jgi:hypothetical protein